MIIAGPVKLDLMLSDKTTPIYCGSSPQRMVALLSEKRLTAGRKLRGLRQEIKESTAQGIAQDPHTSVKAIPIPLPPLAEQRRIVAEVERRLSVVQQAEATVEASLTRAERLRQSILKQAFSGKLVPQDPGDEPASVAAGAHQGRARGGSPSVGLRQEQVRAARQEEGDAVICGILAGKDGERNGCQTRCTRAGTPATDDPARRPRRGTRP